MKNIRFLDSNLSLHVLLKRSMTQDGDRIQLSESDEALKLSPKPTLFWRPFILPPEYSQNIHNKNNFWPENSQSPRPRRSTSICHQHCAVAPHVRRGEILVLILIIRIRYYATKARADAILNVRES